MERLLAEDQTRGQAAAAVEIARWAATAKFAILGLLTAASVLALIAALVRWFVVSR